MLTDTIVSEEMPQRISAPWCRRQCSTVVPVRDQGGFGQASKREWRLCVGGYAVIYPLLRRGEKKTKAGLTHFAPSPPEKVGMRIKKKISFISFPTTLTLS